MKLQVKIQNFKLDINKSPIVSDSYDFSVSLIIFDKIKLFSVPILEKQIEKIKQRYDKMQDDKKIMLDKDAIKYIKNLKIEFKELDLQIQVGLSDAALTAYIVAIIATVLGIILRNQNFENKEKSFNILPVYQDKILFKLSINSIFTLDFTHYIKSEILKKKGSNKNERTSNRKSYDKCYE